MGLTWKDLLGELSDEKRNMLSDERYLENLEYRGGLAYWLSVLEPKKKNYWLAAYRRMKDEHRKLWIQRHPVEAYRMKREKALQAEIKRVGWDEMWERV